MKYKFIHYDQGIDTEYIERALEKEYKNNWIPVSFSSQVGVGMLVLLQRVIDFPDDVANPK